MNWFLRRTLKFPDLQFELKPNDVSKARILVTGGLGYIGSHTMVALIQSGYDIVSLDNEINSSIHVLEGIERITGRKIENIHVNISNCEQTLLALKNQGPFDGIIHFAALKSVEESVFKPTLYFQNNIGGSLTTMEILDTLQIPHLIFSSSCTVYGTPDKLPVTENTPFGKAESPYGATKQVSEIMYDQYFNRAISKSGVSLRYFNPAGAHSSAMIGESPSIKATNLVPVITETVIGLRKEMVVYGNDFDTRDGSCVRDYIAIMDLARAHLLALDYLLENRNQQPYEVFNLGIGEGVTVLEVIKAFEEATGEKVEYKIGPRRAGDVPAIYADNSLITSRIGWTPQENIHSIMQSAWAWEKARRQV